MLLLAVDPGKMTGYAGLMDEAEVPWVDEREALDFCEKLYLSATTSPHPTQLIIEKFTITTETAKKAPQAESLEVTGFLRWFAMHQGWPEPIFYLPSTVMKLYPNPVLRKIGWYTRSKEHGRDATRHLAHHCERTGRLVITPDPV